ncbi:MAG TPA: septal ring lytic transglycosylase RlpA family protein [Solirubrobacteraceae bacterium]
MALLLVAALLSGCGESVPAASGPTRQTATVSGGTAPTASTPPPPAGTAAAPTGTGSAHPIPPAHPVPAAFRPAPGAPSDAEVQRELEQMASVQRRQQQLRLSAAAANLAGLLPWSLEAKSGVQSSVASVFTDYGLGLACGGVLGRNQLGVAHKTAPCGTLITFTYAGRSLTVPVIDRGPYIVGREWDLTGATAAALAFPGLGRIQWSVAS